MRRRSRIRSVARDRGERLALRDLAMVMLHDPEAFASRRRSFTLGDLADIFSLDASHCGRVVAATRGALNIGGA